MTNDFLPDTKDLPENRFDGITRDYTPADVERLRGSVTVQHTLADLGARRLWQLMHDEPYIHALGALTGNQAVQQVKAGLKAIYLSGWQVAADANLAGQMYPDQSLYPANSVPNVVKRINQALQRADQISHLEGDDGVHWFAPIVADAEAGFGGPLNAFEVRPPRWQGAGAEPDIRPHAERGSPRRRRLRRPDCPGGPHRCRRRRVAHQ
jgi:isocitrate lyase